PPAPPPNWRGPPATAFPNSVPSFLDLRLRLLRHRRVLDFARASRSGFHPRTDPLIARHLSRPLRRHRTRRHVPTARGRRSRLERPNVVGNLPRPHVVGRNVGFRRHERNPVAGTTG